MCSLIQFDNFGNLLIFTHWNVAINLLEFFIPKKLAHLNGNAFCMCGMFKPLCTNPLKKQSFNRFLLQMLKSSREKFSR